jgi:hypothetical protein
MSSPESSQEHPEDTSRQTESPDADSTRAVEIAFIPPEPSTVLDDDALDIAPAGEVQVAPPVALPAFSKLAIENSASIQPPTPESPSAVELVPDTQQIASAPEEENPPLPPVETPTLAKEPVEQPESLEKQTPPLETAVTPAPVETPGDVHVREEAPPPPACPEQPQIEPLGSEDAENDGGVPDDEPEREEDLPTEETHQVEKPKAVAPSARSQDVLEKIDASIAAEEVVPSPIERVTHNNPDYKLAFVRDDNVSEFLEATQECDFVALECSGMTTERFQMQAAEMCNTLKELHSSVVFWLETQPKWVTSMVKGLRENNKDIEFLGLTQENPNYEYVAQAQRFSGQLRDAQASNADASQLRVLLANYIYASVMARQKESEHVATQLETLHTKWSGQLIGVALMTDHARGLLRTDSVASIPASSTTYLNEAKNTEDALAPIDPELLDRVLLEDILGAYIPNSVIDHVATETVRGLSDDGVKRILDSVEAIKQHGESFVRIRQEICSFLEQHIAER